VVMSEKVTKSDEEWRGQLTPEQYRVCRRKGTEQAFTGKYWDAKEQGIYRCVCCGNDLFGSETKFDSGTGWPSFSMPMSPEKIRTEASSRGGSRCSAAAATPTWVTSSTTGHRRPGSATASTP